MVIFAEMVFLLNFIVDCLLMIGTNRILGLRTQVKRIMAAALVGGLYGAACMITKYAVLSGPVFRMVVFVLISVIAFGYSGDFGRRMQVFLLLSFALNGIVTAGGSGGVFALLISGILLFGLTELSLGNRMRGTQYADITIEENGRKIYMTALRDTGNMLRDPITGEAVLVISGHEAKKLTYLSEEEIAHPVESLMRKKMPGLRLIPYHGIGNTGGVMLGRRFGNVWIQGKKHSLIVAFAPSGLEGKSYQALLGGTI